MEEQPESSGLNLAAIGSRLRQAVELSKLSATDFAERVGVPYSTFRAYTAGHRAPGAELFASVFLSFGVMPSWLLTGQGPRQLNEATPSAMEDDFVTVPRHHVCASAGPGAFNDENGAVSGLCFSRKWLKKRGLNPANLLVVDTKGGSMYPLLKDGDAVLADKSQTTPRSGFAYVLVQGDELLVKYAQLLPQGILRVSSENSQAYPPYDIDLSRTTDVSILGRVVASTHEW